MTHKSTNSYYGSIKTQSKDEAFLVPLSVFGFPGHRRGPQQFVMYQNFWPREVGPTVEEYYIVSLKKVAESSPDISGSELADL